MSGYINVNNQVKKVKNIYVNVGGQVKKVLKGYIGDSNGIPRQIYKSSTKYVKTWTPTKNDFVNVSRSIGIEPYDNKTKWRVQWQQPNGQQLMRIPIDGNIPLNAKNIVLKVNNITDNTHTKTSIGWINNIDGTKTLFEDADLGDMQTVLANLNNITHVSITDIFYRFYWVNSSFDSGYQVFESVSIEYEIES